jgi:hypothetical protein
LSIADHLKLLGLEPNFQGDAFAGMLSGRLLRIELEDFNVRLEQCQISDDEAAMLAAGLPAG